MINSKSKKVIWVIDDDMAILEAIKIVLEERGFEVVPFTNANKLPRSIDGRSPNLILLDLWLPGIDGETVAKKLKASKITSKIPIIMISANQDLKTIAKTCMVEDFLAKPFEIQDLVRTIDKHIN